MGVKGLMSLVFGQQVFLKKRSMNLLKYLLWLCRNALPLVTFNMMPIYAWTALEWDGQDYTLCPWWCCHVSPLSLVCKTDLSQERKSPFIDPFSIIADFFFFIVALCAWRHDEDEWWWWHHFYIFIQGSPHSSQYTKVCDDIIDGLREDEYIKLKELCKNKIGKDDWETLHALNVCTDPNAKKAHLFVALEKSCNLGPDNITYYLSESLTKIGRKDLSLKLKELGKGANRISG